MQKWTGLIIGSAIGVAATTIGLRVWRSRAKERTGPIHLDDPVEVASDDSFPASDPPSYTSTLASRPAVP